MSDAPSSSETSSSGPRWGVILGGAVVLVAVVVGIVLIASGDDADAPTDSTVAPESTDAPETTEPDTTEPETTDAPDTTEAPGTTDAPDTTEAPPATDAPETTLGPPTLEFSIPGIDDGGTIPVEFTCDGDEISPILTIESIPEAVLSLALIVDDPDAPTENPFVHWLVYNVPGNANSIADDDDTLTYGVNDAGEEAWTGPCPPPGDGPHEYVFTLYALDRELGLDPGLDGRELAEAIDPAVLDQTAISASYERASD